MGFRSNRDIRVALYSFFLGIIVTFLITRFMLLSPKHKRNHKFESIQCKPDRTNADYRDGADQTGNVRCPECPEPVCPLCPESPMNIPDSMEQFITNHIVDLKEGPLVIARTRMKSVDSYLLSLHPSERDMQISHQLTTRGDWNDQLIGHVCHVMHSAPKHAYFVDVGAYVGALAFGVAQCGFSVAAFEPYPHTFRLLQESMSLNHFDNRVKLYNMALGNATGKACLAASSSDRSMARVYRSKDECRNDEVTIDKLDRVLQGATIYYLYMDTGGFEPAVLTGAQSFLTGPNPPKYIHFKASHSGFTKAVMGTKFDLGGTLKWLDRLGYSLRDGSNEPIRSIDEFVMELGHVAEDVVAIYRNNQERVEV